MFSLIVLCFHRQCVLLFNRYNNLHKKLKRVLIFLKHHITSPKKNQASFVINQLFSSFESSDSDDDDDKGRDDDKSFLNFTSKSSP